MLRGGVGVDEPDEFVEWALPPVLKSEADVSSPAPSYMVNADFVRGAFCREVPNCDND